MTNFNDGHPCRGKDCKDCETCIFDRELFPDRVTPNEQKKKNNNLNNMCRDRKCNGCVNLVRSYEHCEEGYFDVACKVVSWEAFGNKRPRRIDYNVTPNTEIATPSWCPLKNSQAQLLSPSQSQVTSRPNPQLTGPGIVAPPTPPNPTSTTATPIYTKREMMKNLARHLEWDDIEEGKVYVIPKILTQSRKIVKVITKTSMSCICHEISEYTGNEYTYNTTFYPSDLDAVFITELHNF